MRPRGRASKPVFATTGHQLPIQRTRFERPTTVGIGCCTCSGHKLPSRPGDFHPEPLTDPDLILSHHPARATA